MDVKYYNLAGEIVLKLNKLGNTDISRMLSPSVWKDIKNKVDKFSCNAEDTEKLYDTLATTINGSTEIKNDLLANMFAYLMILDALSASLDMQTNTLTASPKALNETNRDKIEIYYTYSGLDRDNNFNEHYTYSLSNLIFFIKDKGIYKKLKIKNIYITKETEKLRIGFAPYPPCPNLIFDENENKLVAKKRTALDDYDKDYLQAVKYLSDNKCEVIFGPEMHGSNALDSEIKQLFLESETKVIVCPSWHRNEKGLIINRANVYYRQENNYKRAYLDKCVPAEFSNEKIEGITIDDDLTHEFVLLHIKGFGRVLFLICRDFLSEDLNKLIEDLNADIVFVQCYTPDLTAFKNFADRVQNKRLIFVGNSCTAIKDVYKNSPEHPAPFLYFYYDFKHKKDADPKCCCESECETACTYNHAGCCDIIDICRKEYAINDKTKEGIFVS